MSLESRFRRIVAAFGLRVPTALQRSDGALEWESPGRERSAHAV